MKTYVESRLDSIKQDSLSLTKTNSCPCGGVDPTAHLEIARLRRLLATVDLSKWLMENTSRNDYIILKLDVEGAKDDIGTRSTFQSQGTSACRSS